MKRIIKKIIFILVLLIILVNINTQTKAWSEVVQSGKDFISAGEGSDSGKIQEGELKDLSGYLYNILLAGGVIIAVIVATVLGIQFMVGGAEGQAKVKETLVPFIIGCVVVFGGFAIWKIALTVGKQIESVGIKPETIIVNQINIV